MQVTNLPQLDGARMLPSDRAGRLDFYTLFPCWLWNHTYGTESESGRNAIS